MINWVKRHKLKALGIALLTLWILPTLLLCIPQTSIYLYVIPGYIDIIETSEYTYIPIVDLFRYSEYGVFDVLFLVVYLGVPVLSIWFLIRRGNQANRKEWDAGTKE